MKATLPLLSLIVLCVANILTACTGSIGTPSAPIVKVDLEKGREVTDTVLFEQTGIVILEVTDSSFIRNINKVACLDTLIFISDITENYIYVFNEHGKFLSRIGQLGQGPGEYSSLLDFAADPKRNELILSTEAPRSLLFYSFSGDFLDKTPIPHNGTRIALADNKVIAQEFGGGHRMSVFTLNNHRMAKIDTLDAPPITYGNYITVDGTCFTTSCDTIFYSRRFDNTLYIIQDGKIMPYVKFDFGPYSVTDENEASMDDVKRFLQVANMPNNVRIRGSRLLMNAYPFGLFTYDRVSGKTIHHGKVNHSTLKAAKDSRLRIKFGQMTASWSEDPSTVVFSAEAESVKLIAERAEGLDPELREKLVNLGEEANPVLFFYRMR
mgnify:CR=1 FL=1